MIELFFCFLGVGVLFILLDYRPTPPPVEGLEIRDLQGKVICKLPRADMWNQSFVGRSFVAADLRGAHMGASNFEGCDFRGADLTRADLSGSNLKNCDFESANLAGADLSRADLTNANLLFANLGEKRERVKLDEVKGFVEHELAMHMHDVWEHGRIQNFQERREYALHLKAAVSETRRIPE